MLARLRTKRYQKHHAKNADWREHRLAIQRASYYRHQKERLAAKRRQYIESKGAQPRIQRRIAAQECK
jgi:hypothetical protein